MRAAGMSPGPAVADRTSRKKTARCTRTAAGHGDDRPVRALGLQSTSGCPREQVKAAGVAALRDDGRFLTRICRTGFPKGLPAAE